MSDFPEDFGQLRKLMKLKNYEQPPPGYFNNFSTIVINRIESKNRQGESLSGQWLVKFFRLLETNPIAAGVFGMSVCSLLVSGIIYSTSNEPITFSTTGNQLADSGAGSNETGMGKAVKSNAMLASTSTSPMMEPNFSGALFTGLDKTPVQQASFTVGN